MRGELAANGVNCGNILLALAAALSLALTGCTSWEEYCANGFKVGPNYCPPGAAVAENWIDADDRRISTGELDLSRWWTVFGDEELNCLVRSAYEQNLTLKEAGFRIMQARAALAIQVGNLFPQTQQALGGYTRNAESIDAANRQFLDNRYFDQWDLGFNLAWELDFWGRFRRAIEASAAELDASVFDYDDVLVTLLGDVALTYIEIRTIQQQIAYVRENVAIQTTSLEIATARFRGGLTSDLDVEQATSNLAQTQALIPQFEIRLRQANNRLCILLGLPTEDPTLKLGQDKIPTAPAEVAVGIPCDLLTRRPDVRRAESEAHAQCARIGIAQSNLYPHIAVTGTVGYSAEKFSNLLRPSSLQGSVGPGFNWDVLNYGRLINAVRLEDARFLELVVRYRNVVLQANGEVEDGLVEFLQSQQRAKFLQQSVNAATKAVQLAIIQYKNGLVDFNRVALLEQTLVQQQDQLAQAQGNIALGLVRVYRALGGGWEIRCAPDSGFGDGALLYESEGGMPETVEPGAARPDGTREPDELPAPAKPQAADGGVAPTTPRLPWNTEVTPEPNLPAPKPIPLDNFLPKPLPDPFAPQTPGEPPPRSPSIIQPMSAGKPADGTPPMAMSPKLRYPNRVLHSGLLPEDRGEVRKWR